MKSLEIWGHPLKQLGFPQEHLLIHSPLNLEELHLVDEAVLQGVFRPAPWNGAGLRLGECFVWMSERRGDGFCPLYSFFLRERKSERARTWGTGREREGDTESEAGSRL